MNDSRNELTGDVHGKVVQAGRINTVYLGGKPVEVRVPRMLPVGVPHFLNRASELGLLGKRQGRVTLTGAPGIGKTTLAIRWAHQVKDQFPGGQLFYRLNGSGESGPAAPADVLLFFLQQFDVPHIPDTEDERAALFRSVTADLKLLVVLDDAVSARQVENLLPGSADSAVVVTSRTRLDGLRMQGFSSLVVERFSDEVAAQFVSLVAEELADEPEHLRALARLCGGLPLALHIAAVRLATGDYGSIAEYVSVLNDSRQLFRELAIGDDRLVEAVFEVSYRELAKEPARAYRLLGKHFGPDFTVPLAAVVLDESESDARRALNVLVASNLLTVSQGRYSFHNLIRQHARDASARTDTDSTRIDALRRGLAWYLRRALALGKVIHPERPSIAGKLWEVAEPAHDSRDKALAELAAERLNFRAAVRTANRLGAYRQVCELTDALSQWYYQSGHLEDRVETHDLAAAAAEAADDRALAGHIHKLAGIAAEAVGDFPLALQRFADALRLASAAIDRQSALEWAGIVLAQTGDRAAALARFQEAWEVVVPDDLRPRAQAMLRMHIGRTLGPDADVAELKKSLDYFVARNERGNATRVLLLLAELEGSATMAEQAIADFEADGMARQQAQALELLARLRQEDAARSLERAADIYRRLGRVDDLDRVLR
ncbi:NB-ARC domain-containing protein [Allokutzneria sp. A3M-2-11 16]|uniref:NB-ARC domain-containing protein n=1 Tax=Allokutzneria sp. A3M-2-11 16 TaxID=2962043 RepID=UPI0020B662F6|nr:NB-ARC domain-containing protein [Allokutzneria sp. A3M-2-11 16]MCP3802087.1 NB-ARC domain-containing protein [Allokutzneria sp. A3M-2-11 16]